MDARELPHGSLINFKTEIVKVDWANEYSIQFYQIESGYEEPAFALNINRLFKPIKLTEDWLMKFGFRAIDERLYCKRWRLNRVDIYKMISGNYPFYFRFNQVELKIKHVHQLQNLFFVLTGEMLAI